MELELNVESLQGAIEKVAEFIKKFVEIISNFIASWKKVPAAVAE